jgi:hypothetical protein
MSKYIIAENGKQIEVTREEYEARKTKPRATFGLGDAVAAIANPIARALDATLGTKIQGCGGCARRRDALNQILPNLGKPHKSDEQ